MVAVAGLSPFLMTAPLKSSGPPMMSVRESMSSELEALRKALQVVCRANLSAEVLRKERQCASTSSGSLLSSWDFCGGCGASWRSGWRTRATGTALRRRLRGLALGSSPSPSLASRLLMSVGVRLPDTASLRRFLEGSPRSTLMDAMSSAAFPALPPSYSSAFVTSADGHDSRLTGSAFRIVPPNISFASRSPSRGPAGVR
mmetsp:Transcript_11648/g.33556  ORF Transcript_11648/g.33556 Transcript_11648/m.33556 type:complete len:201 (+) Transcript_11648:1762-2364(+)